MNERELLHIWYQSGGVVVQQGQIEIALQILRDQAQEKSFAVQPLLGGGWQITKIF